MFDVKFKWFLPDSGEIILKLNIHVSVGCSINRPVEMQIPLLAAAVGCFESDPLILAVCVWPNVIIHFRFIIAGIIVIGRDVKRINDMRCKKQKKIRSCHNFFAATRGKKNDTAIQHA